MSTVKIIRTYKEEVINNHTESTYQDIITGRAIANIPAPNGVALYCELQPLCIWYSPKQHYIPVEEITLDTVVSNYWRYRYYFLKATSPQRIKIFGGK